MSSTAHLHSEIFMVLNHHTLLPRETVEESQFGSSQGEYFNFLSSSLSNLHISIYPFYFFLCYYGCLSDVTIKICEKFQFKIDSLSAFFQFPHSFKFYFEKSIYCCHNAMKLDVVKKSTIQIHEQSQIKHKMKLQTVIRFS